MTTLKIQSDPRVKDVFKKYPPKATSRLKYLRKLILECAKEISDIKELEETLKWGEPSYLVKKGSTIRIDYKEKTPEQYAMYFKCTSKLVPTFKEIFGNIFEYENNRALLFGMDEQIPEKELKQCISMALRYHKIKDKPLLGY